MFLSNPRNAQGIGREEVLDLIAEDIDLGNSLEAAFQPSVCVRAAA